MLNGTSSISFNVAAVDDTIIEITETFDITISSIANITLFDDTAIGSILDNDLVPGTGIAFTNTNIIVTEGTDAFAVFNVTLTGTIAENVTVDYTTVEGTALNPGDITTTAGTITFTPTVSSFDIQVPIADDTVIEPTEGFTVVLSNVQSNLGLGIVGPDTANGTINDDDANVGDGIAFTNTNVIVTEGTDAFAVFNVTLTGAISENVTVDYTTNEGTALNPGDITTTAGTITFTPTVNSFDIQVPITDDMVIEATEGFTVVLSNVQSNLGLGIVGPDTANGTINDDDAVIGTGIAFTNTNVIVTEGTDAFAVFNVTLTGTISENVTVDYTTNEGTALNPGDITTTAGTITFTPTVSSFDIQVPITDDMVIEATEGFTVVLSNVQSNLGLGIVGPDTANGTINDDDMKEIMVEPYEETMTIICGEEIPEAPILTFTGGCGNYIVDFTEVEEFSTGTDDFSIVRTWNVTDACGNTASFEQVIYVLQREGSMIEIDICVEDNVIDLIDYLPAGFDKNGTFTITEADGNTSLEGSLFDPSGFELGEYLIAYESTAASCKYFADFVITVNADCVPCNINDLVVSKTITINGDGINDFFELSGLENCGYTYNVKIFNRWGTMVYESQDYRNNWGGNAPGGSFGTSTVVPTGTYYYIIALSDAEIKPINGYIYIGSK